MEWKSVKDQLPENNSYCLIVSDCGWIGYSHYFTKDKWCRTEYPDVICDGICYDVHNDDITHWMYIEEVPTPYQPERSKREDCIICKWHKILSEAAPHDMCQGENADAYKVWDVMEEMQMRCSEHCG